MVQPCKERATAFDSGDSAEKPAASHGSTVVPVPLPWREFGWFQERACQQSAETGADTGRGTLFEYRGVGDGSIYSKLEQETNGRCFEQHRCNKNIHSPPTQCAQIAANSTSQPGHLCYCIRYTLLLSILRSIKIKTFPFI